MMMANLMRRSKSVPFDLLLSYSAAFIPNLLLHRRKNEPRRALLALWSLASFSESLPQKENHGCPSVRPSVRSLLNRCCVAAGEGRRFIEKHASSPTVFKVAIVSRDRPPQKVCLAVQKRSVTRYVRDLLEMLNVQKSSFAAYPLVKTQKIYCFDTRYSCLSGGARGERGASGPCPISLGCYSASAPLSAPLI